MSLEDDLKALEAQVNSTDLDAEQQTDNNEHIEKKVPIIVVDDGSNYIKVCSKDSDGKTNTFTIPSRVVRKAMAAATVSGYSDCSYSIDGSNYTVSKTAIGSIPTNVPSYQVSDHNRVLIHHALKQLGIQGEAEVVVTVPIGQFFEENSARNDVLINQKIKNTKGAITHLDGTETVNITGCYVIPEGVAAYAYVKEELKLTGSRYLLADIGGTTTDILALSDDSQIECFKSAPIGALNMLKKFSQKVCSHLDLVELSDDLAINGLLSGVVIGSDVSELARAVIKEFEQDFNDELALMGELKIFDGVIFSGGGASLLNSDYITALKTKEPQLDNARGAMLMLG